MKKKLPMLVTGTLLATISLNLDNNNVEEVRAESSITQSLNNSMNSQIIKNIVYLSDLQYQSASTGWKSVTTDTNILGGKITLNINGKTTEFTKGVGAHATSTVIYDLSKYNGIYTRFKAYLGIDTKSAGGYRNGVTFTISISEDGQSWTDIKQTETITNEAEYVDLDITGAKYLKLYASDNGNSDLDHAIYADAKITTSDYKEGSYDSIPYLNTIDEYDAILKAHSIEDNLKKNKDIILKREFLNRVGYSNLLYVYNISDYCKEAIDYLLSNNEALELYLMSGEVNPDGSYTRSIMNWCNLFAAHGSDFSDPSEGDLYLKLAISISMSHADPVFFWTGNSKVQDPVKRYESFKELYDDGKMEEGGSTEVFKNLPSALMRWVTDTRLHEDEVIWLADYALKEKANNKNYLDAYNYINYTFDYNYNDTRYYDVANYNQWNEKYDLSAFDDYGSSGIHRLFMVFEEGSVCGGLAKTYATLAEVFGRPAAVVGQPGHAATIIYNVNDEGKGMWSIANDISGWTQSRHEMGDMVLGWGMDSWSSNWSASYILLTQNVLDDYKKYLEASYLNFLAEIYEEDAAKQEEIYLQALSVQQNNLDSMVGLINAYKKQSNKSSDDYLHLAEKIIEAYTYFPLPMSDLLNLLKDYITGDSNTVTFDLMKTNALIEATQATTKESLQPGPCKDVANYLLGNNSVNLASFSFDGENAGQIVIDSKYSGSQIRIKYSLDGGQNWTETNEHIIMLSQEELKTISAENDILVGLVGGNSTFTIDIKESTAPTNSTLYKNDLENKLIGNITNLEFSTDNGVNWCNYTNDIKFEGHQVVKVRYKAHGQYLASKIAEYTFDIDTDNDTRKYVSIDHLSIADFSSQINNSDIPSNIINGTENSGWHNKGEEERFVTIELDSVKYITALEYVSRFNNGKLKSADIYTSLDGEKWEKSGSVNNLRNDTTVKAIELDQPTATKYIKIVATETYGSKLNWFFTCSMLNVFEDLTKETAPEVTVTYSTEKLTNQDVTATIELPEGYILIGDETHTFTENGTHTFTYQSPTGKEYTHTITVDWIDKVAPTATLSYSTTNKTNQSVTATLNIQEENITVENNKTSHIFDSNGEYIFTIRDQAGNKTEIKAEVTWIDKEKPVLDVTYSTEEETDQPVTATLITEDVQVKSINGKVITVTNNNGSTDYIFTENGEFIFEYIDDYGNAGSTAAQVNWIVKTPIEEAPDIKVTYSTEKLTNQDVTATIELPEGYILIGDETHTFTENGTHTFTYQSPTGKEYTHTITVDWIDKVAPTATLSYSTTNKTNQSVTATLNIQEENITVENNKTSHIFDSNGEYIFTIHDQAGNKTEIKAEVTWIDKEKPVLDVTYSTEEETDQPVTATLITEDVQVKSINGKVITVTNNNGSTDYIFTENGEFIFEYIDDYGNAGSTAAQVNWIVKTPIEEAPEQPNYIIPDSIKPLIDPTIVSVNGGNGTQDNPLSVQVLDSVDVNTLTTIMESFGVYRLTFERKEQQDESPIITYLVTVQNDSDTYYLTITVSVARNEIINYLDSLIKDPATTPESNPSTDNTESGLETPESNPSTNNTESGSGTPESNPSTGNTESGSGTPESNPSTGNTESSTTNPINKPETGLTSGLPFILNGVMTTLSGIVIMYKNRRN